MLRLMTLFVLAAVFLSAQEVRATISGTISDPNGAVIPGAKISVRNLGTGAVTDATTNEAGLFVAPFIPIGHYQVSAS
ncbi:MAG: carboxypeptidase regulatory-like domain-containing protein, partial [Bryobacterales bacterium]|nr:carboxypeptidase regulatory-like domain-containing protein [Bryobacterales bacterium]